MKQRFVATLGILVTFTLPAGAAQTGPFGAIATSANAWGQAHNKSTLMRAENDALTMCRSKSQSSCGVRVWWSGAGVCGALAHNITARPPRYGWASARNIQTARAKAVQNGGGGAAVVAVCNN